MNPGQTKYGAHSAKMIETRRMIDRLNKTPRSELSLWITEDGRHAVAVTCVGHSPDAGVLWDDVVGYGPVSRWLSQLDGVPSLKPMAFPADAAPRSVAELTPEAIRQAERLAEDLIEEFRAKSGPAPKGP